MTTKDKKNMKMIYGSDQVEPTSELFCMLSCGIPPPTTKTSFLLSW